ncbi:MAG: lamin tail domain-containing protein, partial [Planctomycetota bacterium]
MLRLIRILLYSLILAMTLPGTVEAESPPSLVINEFMASNNSSARDPQGQYDDWIEIYNFGSDAVDIGGCYLTDNLSIPAKWRIPFGNPTLTTIPPHGYLLIWADNDTAYSGLHANFKLDAGGEQIALFDSDGITLIDEVVFGRQTTDLSSGRFPDASNNWHYFGDPSPGKQNVAAYLGEVADTKFSHNRGFYEAPFSVTIATETKGAIIYYTLDGTEPYDTTGNKRSSTGRVYTGPVSINTTTSLRAIAVKPDFKSTNIDTQTYIFLDDVIRQPARPVGFPTNWGHTGRGDYEMDPQVVNNSRYRNTIKDDMKSVPTVSLVMDLDDWFGSRGIYTHKSQDGTERVVSMEFIEPNKGEGFQINCALSMQGGVSGGGTSLNRWKSDKLSMRPRFKATTDDGTPTGGLSKLNYKVFVDSPVEKFDTLVLDARLGNAWNYGGGVTDTGSRPWISGRPIYQPDVAQYTRDQFVADIQNAFSGYSHHGRHIHLYINGLYWGLYNLHERPDHRFAASYFGGDADDYDCLKHNRNMIINGSNVSYNEMLSIAESGLASNEQYQLIQKYLDVPNFIDYVLPNYYVGNYDWGHKNWYVTRNSSDPNGLWRFHHWDGEHLMENLYENVTGRNNAGGPTRLHHRLMQNAEYRLLFADHVHRHFFNDGDLTPEGAGVLYQVRLNDVDRAVIGESARWGDNQIDRFARIRYMREPHWLLERDWILGTYIPNRTGIVLDQFRARGWYPNVDAPIYHVNGSYQHGGHIATTDLFSMAATTGTIYYTFDGSDPRLPQISPDESTSKTLVPEHMAKRVLVPTGNINSNWRGGGVFDDSAWRFTTGNPGGVGYERSSGYQDLIKLDLEEQMYTKNATCYIRIVFAFNDNLDDFNFMTLKMLYDDGFIAYINGVEVARSNFTGTPRWNSSANGSRSDSLAVNFDNIDISAHLNTLQNGRNILAIHGLNTSTTSSDFFILPELVAGESSSPGDGGTSLGAQQYNGPIMLNNSVHVKARILSGSTWSALNEAIFAVGRMVENLRISEIMYNPNDPNTEYIELKNIGVKTINLNLVKFTNGIDFTFPNIELTGNEYVVVVRDSQAFETRYGTALNIAGQYSGRLNNAGERIKLEDAIGQTILDFDFKDGWRSITDGDGFSLTVIDPADTELSGWNEKDSWRASAYLSGSPGEDDGGIVPEPGAVVINEVLAHSHAEAVDWIELHNTTDTSIDIGGWFLSDSSSDLTKYRIAQGTIIAQGGYIVFYEDQHFNNPSDPGSNLPFALSENGERLYLSSAEGSLLTGYRQVEDFGGSETGVSFGRYYKPSTGNYNFVPMSENTPDLANAYPKVGPIVINEIMYNPSWPVGGLYTNDQYEYVELHNISSEPVSLYDFDTAQPWKFTDGIDFTFPADVPVTIPAGGYLLVVKDPEAFSWRYPAVPVENILGPYNGSLNNAGERLELSS